MSSRNPTLPRQPSGYRHLRKFQFELLRQAEAHRLLKREERRIFDTSHARSNTRAVSLPRLFAGQTRQLGLDAFFKARYLDTTIGKFHAPDTIVPDPGNPQALNRYSYVMNQLLKFTDPSGHMVSAGGDGGGAVTSITDASGTTSAVGTAADTVGDPSQPIVAPAPAPTPDLTGTATPTSWLASPSAPIGSEPASGNGASAWGGLGYVGLGLASGHPWTAAEGLGMIAGGFPAGDPTLLKDEVVLQGGLAGLGQLDRLLPQASGMVGLFRAATGAPADAAAVASIRLVQGAVFKEVMPGIGSAVGVVQGLSALNDLQQHPNMDVHQRVSDYFQVAGGAIGGAALVALAAVVVVGASPEIVEGLALAGTVATIGAAAAYLV